MWQLLMAAEQVQSQTGHLISPKAAQSGSSCIPSCALRAGSRRGRGTCTVIQSNSELWEFERGYRGEQQPTPVLLPGEFHGQRSLAGCSP